MERGRARDHLLGQNVNAYHGAPRAVTGAGPPDPCAGGIDGLARIRFTTSTPTTWTMTLIEAHGDLRKADALSAPARAVRLDRILKRMNRQHTAESYLRDRSTNCAPRGPTCCCRGISSSASPKRPRRISRPRSTDRARRITAMPTVQILHPPRHPGGGTGPGARRRQGRPPAAPAGADHRPAESACRTRWWAAPWGAVRKARPRPGQMVGKSESPARGARDRQTARPAICAR